MPLSFRSRSLLGSPSLFKNWNYEKCGNVIHGTDTQEYYSYFHNYPDNISDLVSALRACLETGLKGLDGRGEV
jgi:hypothetical protein